MDDKALVIINYQASTPSGESMFLWGKHVKSTKNKDVIEFNYDFKYILSSVTFTDLFEKLHRDVREKIITHVLERVSSGELVKKIKITEYIARFSWGAMYFEKAGVAKKNDMHVSWVDSCHISQLELHGGIPSKSAEE